MGAPESVSFQYYRFLLGFRRFDFQKNPKRCKVSKKMKKVGFFEKIARIRKRNDTELILKNRAFFKESIFSKLTLSHLEKNAIFSILGGGDFFGTQNQGFSERELKKRPKKVFSKKVQNSHVAKGGPPNQSHAIDLKASRKNTVSSSNELLAVLF